MDTNEKQTFEIALTRVFNAPRERVFKAWTDHEHFAKWWGPKGFTLEIVRMDARTGGELLGVQTSLDRNLVLWGKFSYQEIVEPEKVTYIRSFSDEQGNTVRSPFSASWPLEILNIITLKDVEGKTALKLEGGPVNATVEEAAEYFGMVPMLLQDLERTFDKLADYLVSS